MRLYGAGEIVSSGGIDRTGAQTMLYLTCTMIVSEDLAHYGVSRAEDWVSVDCGTNTVIILDVPNFRIFTICIFALKS